MAPKKGGAKGGAAAPANAGPSHEYNTNDVVLAKVKGYPEWPGKLIDQTTAPAAVAAVKGSRPFLVRFFPDGDYIWAYTKELKPLAPKTIDAFLSDTGKKSGKLKTGYEIARDPSAWEAEQAEKDKAAAEAEGAESAGDDDDGEDEDDEDVDMLAEDGEEKPSAAKKRKRAAGNGDDKPAKAPKKDTAAAAKGKKAAADKEKKAPASKAKKEPATKKRKTDDKPESKKANTSKAAKGATAKDKAAPSSAPADDTSEGAKTVKGWRAALQKGFLTKGVPEADKMPEYDTIFKNMEAFEMQAEWLAISKLGKVLKKMSALDNIAREEEFKLRERCNALMDKWKEMLNKEGGDEAAGGAVAAAGGAGEVAGTEANAATDAGDLTMVADEGKPAENGAEEKKEDVAVPAAEEEKKEANGGDKKEGVNAEGQTNGVPETEVKDAAPAAGETNGSA